MLNTLTYYMCCADQWGQSAVFESNATSCIDSNHEFSKFFGTFHNLPLTCAKTSSHQERGHSWTCCSYIYIYLYIQRIHRIQYNSVSCSINVIIRDNSWYKLISFWRPAYSSFIYTHSFNHIQLLENLFNII